VTSLVGIGLPVSRYYVTVEVVTVSCSGLTRQHIGTVTARVREFWPLTALIAKPGDTLPRTNVVGEFGGPTEAMFVLGVVKDAFELAGEEVIFRGVSIRTIQHDTPLTVEDLARNG
jgi:hypothetical protein